MTEENSQHGFDDALDAAWSERVATLTEALAKERAHQVATLTAERDAAKAGVVRVKPLVWTNREYDWSWWADIPFGRGMYQIRHEVGYFVDFDDETISGCHRTLGAAKAAAQADYEARILAALEPAPVSDEALIRAALEAAAETLEGLHDGYYLSDAPCVIRDLATDDATIAAIRERAKG